VARRARFLRRRGHPGRAADLPAALNACSFGAISSRLFARSRPPSEPRKSWRAASRRAGGHPRACPRCAPERQRVYTSRTRPVPSY